MIANTTERSLNPYLCASLIPKYYDKLAYLNTETEYPSSLLVSYSF